jgi:D-serine deaminase-like pyridoxal phosphate-dependent protein
MFNIGSIINQVKMPSTIAVTVAIKSLMVQLSHQSHEEIVAAYAVSHNLSIHEARRILVLAGANALGLLKPPSSGGGPAQSFGSALNDLTKAMQNVMNEVAKK